jgi:hypothetical protein
MKRFIGVLAVVAAVAPAGCKPAPVPTKQPAPPQTSPPVAQAQDGGRRGPIPKGYIPALDRETAMADLRQIGIYYREYQTTTGRGPAKLEDLADMKKEASRLYKSIENGQYVLYWGASGAGFPGGASNTVLGYSAGTPKDGGVALMADGTPKPITAAEFKAAPKAGK